MDTEEDEDVQVEEEEEAPARRTIKPNPVFLGRMLQGLGSHNKRVVDTQQSKAARKAVGTSGAASIRPILLRAHKSGPAAIRRAALTAAEQQKLTLCTSLLTEVALSFGFRLRVVGSDGGLVSPSAEPTSPVDPTSPAADTETAARAAARNALTPSRAPSGAKARARSAPMPQQDGSDASDGEGAHQGQGERDDTPGQGFASARSSSPQPLPLQDLTVSLSLAGGSAAGAGVGATAAAAAQAGSASDATPSTQGEATRGAAVAKGTALLTAARPRIALNSLEGLTTALRRAAGGKPAAAAATAGTAGTAQQARARPLVTRPVSGTHQGMGGHGSSAVDTGSDPPSEPAHSAADTSDTDPSDTEPTHAHTTTGPNDAQGGTGKGNTAESVNTLLAGRLAKARIQRQGGAASPARGGGVGATAAAAGRAGSADTAARRAGVLGAASATGRSTPDESMGGGGGGDGTATPPAGSSQQPSGSGGSGGKRPAGSSMNGLFSAALRDLKKVRQVSSASHEDTG